MMSRIEMMPSTWPLERTTRWRKPPRAIASAASSRPQSPSANVAFDVRWSRTSSESGSSPDPSERTRSRSVTIPGPGSSGSMITAAPTLCSTMNAAASRRVRPGVIVNTCSVIASRTFTTTPLACGYSQARHYLPRWLSCWARMQAERFPLGAAVTVGQLEGDPHALLARLRETEPVSWLPAIGGWLVTRRDLALRAMRDAGAFTVQDPRFTTAQVVGPSMLSLDGPEHD